MIFSIKLRTISTQKIITTKTIANTGKLFKHKKKRNKRNSWSYLKMLPTIKS